MLPGLTGIAGMGTLKPSSVAYLTQTHSDANASTYTFSSQTLGVAASDRIIIVGVAGNDSSSSISSVTVGGVAANLIVERTGALNLGIAAAAVPTGLTGNVVVEFSVSKSSCAIGLWRATGQITTSGVASSFNSDLSELTLAAEPGGFVIAVCANVTLDSGRTTTWAGAAEDFDAAFEIGLARFSGASASTLGGTVSVQPTLSGVPLSDAFAAATF